MQPSRTRSAGRIVSSRALALVIVLLVVLATVPGTVAAATRVGGTVVVGPNEVVDGDLDVFAGTATVYGTVNGDVSGVAGTLVIYGTVTGDVSGTAGTIEIARGAVVDGRVAAAAGTIRIAGTVTDDVEVGAGEIILAPTAEVGGDVSYGGQLTREDGALVGGTVEQVDTGTFGLFVVPSWIPDLYVFVLGLLTLSIFVAVFPRASDRIRETGVADPLRSGVAGILTLLAVPTGLVLLALTIVGIPLTVVGIVLFVFAAWIGSLYGRLVVGSWLLGYVDVPNRWAAVGVGMLAVAVAIRLPVIGGLLNLLVFLLGLGALATVLVRSYRGTDRDQTKTVGDAAGPGEEAGRPA